MPFLIEGAGQGVVRRERDQDREVDRTGELGSAETAGDTATH